MKINISQNTLSQQCILLIFKYITMRFYGLIKKLTYISVITYGAKSITVFSVNLYTLVSGLFGE